MENFTPKKIDLSQINNGVKWKNGDEPNAETFNAPIEASAYAQQIAEEALSKINTVLWDNILKLYYPVNSIYISASEVSPSELFGGNWVRIEDSFLLATGSKFAEYDNEDGVTGGSATKTLTVGQLPSHSHKWVYGQWDSAKQLSFQTYEDDGETNNSWEMISTKQDKKGKRTSMATNNTGSGEAFDVMPPYTRVYVWKRIA